MKRALMTSTASLVIGLGLLTIADTRSYSQTTPQAPAQVLLDQNLVDMKDLTTQGEQLKRDAESALKEFDEKQRELESAGKDTHTAGEKVDELIKILQAAAERLGPNGEFIKILKQQEDYVRQLAADAMASQNSGDHIYGEQLTNQGSKIELLRQEASALAAQLAAQIDRVTRSKTQIVLAYAVKHTEDFINAARSYLDTARKILEGTASYADKANKIVAPAIESQ